MGSFCRKMEVDRCGCSGCIETVMVANDVFYFLQEKNESIVLTYVPGYWLELELREKYKTLVTWALVECHRNPSAAQRNSYGRVGHATMLPDSLCVDSSALPRTHSCQCWRHLELRFCLIGCMYTVFLKHFFQESRNSLCSCVHCGTVNPLW